MRHIHHAVNSQRLLVSHHLAFFYFIADRPDILTLSSLDKYSRVVSVRSYLEGSKSIWTHACVRNINTGCH